MTLGLALCAEESRLPASSTQSLVGKGDAVPRTVDAIDIQLAYELALLRNETLGMRQEEVRAAEARFWQAVGAALPQVHILATGSFRNEVGGSFGGGGGNVAGSASQSGSSGSSQAGGSGFGGGSFSNNPESFNSRLNVKMPIFSGFKEYYTGKAGKAEIEQARQNKNRYQQLLFLDVTDAFYQTINYQQDLEILSRLAQTHEKRVATLQERVRLGKSRDTEMISARTDLAEARVTYETTRGLLGASKELLAFLTGIPAHELKLKDSVLPIPSKKSLQEYLQINNLRPDVLAAVQAERSSRAQVSAAAADYWPKIAGEGSYEIYETPETPSEWSAFITFDLPIFDGGVTAARVRERKSILRSSQLDLARLEREADKEVRVAYNNFVSSVGEVLKLKEAVVTAEQNYRQQEDDYSHHIITQLDVLQSLRQLNDLMRRLQAGEIAMKRNLVRLHVATGDLK